MDWQPIETAPKDGTWILSWDGYAQTIIARDKDGWFGTESGNPLEWTNSGHPTHWMPLPAPPTSSPSSP